MPVKARIYLDTSVINFLYATDAPGLMERTKIFFNTYIKAGIYDAYVSDVVVEEINNTTNETRRNQLLSVIEDYHLSYANMSSLTEINNLADLCIFSIKLYQ